MPSIYDLASNYDMGEPGGQLPVVGAPILASQAVPTALAPMAQMPAASMATAPVEAQIAAPIAAPPGDRNQALMSMLGKYFPQGDDYGKELTAARATMTKESEAFNNLLQSAIKQPQETGPSKAEMYFRLAAAFGAPTKTGNFMESLGKAGEAAATMNKEQRESTQAERARRLSLGLEAQKLRMSGAKEDLTTLRTLASEGMKDKRTIATDLIKEYVKSGQPESSAGKQAKDEGLVPGTPGYQKRVGEIANMNVDRQMAQINATLANISVAQANATLQQQKFGLQQEQAAKLTPVEVRLKTDTEDTLGQTLQGYRELQKAKELSGKSFALSGPEFVQFTLLDKVGSKDPKVENTRELINILKKASLAQLKPTFPGAVSNEERKALDAVQGLESASSETRTKIIENAMKAANTVYGRTKKRLNEINSGLYRSAGSIDEGEK